MAAGRTSYYFAMTPRHLEGELTIGEVRAKTPPGPEGDLIRKSLDTYPLPKGAQRETFRLNIGATRAFLRQIAVLEEEHQPDPPVKNNTSQKEDAERG